MEVGSQIITQMHNFSFHFIILCNIDLYLKTVACFLMLGGNKLNSLGLVILQLK
jgi:hypothetical protein